MKYDVLQAQTRTELAVRTAVLQADVAAWTEVTRTTAMGFSPSQRAALVDMMDVLIARQQTLLGKLPQATTAGATTAGATTAGATTAGATTAGTFADVQVDFVVETTGANELWHLFRSILEQQEDVAFRASVQAATRIAGDCYAQCVRKARIWNAITPERFREQPVVYLEAVDSPATASRGNAVQSLSLAVREWRNLKLPLPIALMPYDYAHSIWTFCALHHETGHNLDQDLGLLAGLRGALLDVVPAGQEPRWRKWSAEILADAIGVTLGGAGFALSLATDALMLGPAARYQTLDADAVHPPFLVRVAILIAMLRCTGVPGLEKWATEIDEAWMEIPRAPWMGPFAAAAPAVAELFLKRTLTTLGDHCVLDFNPELAAEHDLVTALASYFATGMKRPDPATMSARLVPVAAQLAVRQAGNVDAAAVSALHQKTMAYLDLVPRGGVLAAAGGDRRGYLQDLTRAVRFPTQRSEAQ